MKMLAAVTVCWVLAVVSCEVQYQHPEEWQLWKTQHGKSYESEREELERHLVWLSNREYINAHNKNSDLFGFTLSMNHFGDMVTYFQPLSLLTLLSPFRLMLSIEICSSHMSPQLTRTPARYLTPLTTATTYQSSWTGGP